MTPQQKLKEIETNFAVCNLPNMDTAWLISRIKVLEEALDNIHKTFWSEINLHKERVRINEIVKEALEGTEK